MVSNDIDKPRPILAENITEFGELVLPLRREGEIVMFSPSILHSAFNIGSTKTRVSIEFAIGNPALTQRVEIQETVK